MEKLLSPVFGDVNLRPESSIMGLGYNLLIDAEQTDGRFELMKFLVPSGLAPPKHCHQHEDEFFLVLEGQFEASVGDTISRVSSGSYLHLPRGIPHSLRNDGDSEGSFLCWVTPANLGPFFDKLKKPWQEGDRYPTMLTEADIQHLTRTAAEFGIELL